jgi:glycerol-3-phosphate dehydrogenase
MVYTFPPPGYPGIGVHLTRLLSGELLIGPTATYQKSDHPPALPETPLERFLDKSRPLLPDLQLEDLEYAPAGVRAKPVPPNSPRPFEDFVLAEEASARGVLHLIGLESPGLTASPAVAEYVCDWFDRSGRRG